MPLLISNPFRSLLFVPGDQPKKILKAWQSGADCVVLDLEDGVSARQKALARETVAGAVTSLPSEVSHALVRINGCPEWEEDLNAAIHPGVFGLIVPKCTSAEEVVQLDRALESAEIRRRMRERPVRIFLLVETARGLLDLSALAAASDRTAGLVLGAEDLCLNMGIPRTPEGAELAHARWQIVLCARANGLLAIDAVFPDFQDAKGLWQDTRRAMSMGFTGKLAIHPRQIEPIHSAFAPDDTEVSNARAILAAFESAQVSGAGAIAFEGKMVDKPVADRARQILRRAYPSHGDSG